MSQTIDLFKSQHKSALRICGSVTDFLKSSEHVKKNAQAIRILLAQLKGVLTVHLKSEDQILYGTLLKSSNEKTKAVAESYDQEMKSISVVVLNYLDRWTDVSKIEESPDLFTNETKQIFAALSKRIQAEESELYPLF